MKAILEDIKVLIIIVLFLLMSVNIKKSHFSLSRRKSEIQNCEDYGDFGFSGL